MLTKMQLVRTLCRRRFPDADAMYELYKSHGTLELPPNLSNLNQIVPRLSQQDRDRKQARYESIRTAENRLLSMSYEELQAELQKESHIETLCTLTIPGYTDHQRSKEVAAMRVPAANSSPQPFFAVDPMEAIRKANSLKAELREKSPDEVRKLLADAQAKNWCNGKYSIDEVAALIAAKIYPDDGCPWTLDDRKNCESEYKVYLRRVVLSGMVAFHNPYNQGVFEYDRLSDDRFPQNGLISIGDFYCCLMPKHAEKGYFPKPISEAPAAIRPLAPSFSSTQGLETLRISEDQVTVATEKARCIPEEMQNQAVSPPASPTRDTPFVPKHTPKQRLQEMAILEWLRNEYGDAKALPKPQQGKSGPKAAAWMALVKNKTVFQSRSVFDKAWDRLRASEDIQDAK